MKKEDVSRKDAKLLKLVLQELGDDPFRKFHIAFALMTVIPFLVFFYIISVRVSTIDVLVGNVGVILAISLAISLGGLYIGYEMIRAVLTKVVHYAVKLKDSDRVKSSFVVAVSHELKNPLASIKMSLSNMLEGMLGKMSIKQKKIIHFCQEIVDRIVELLGDLFNLHRFEAGAVEMRRKFCNLVEVVEKQVAEFQVIYQAKGVKLIKDVSEKTLSIWGDESKLKEAISNILGNALKYTPKGGRVAVKAYNADKFVRIECADTGQGIPVDKLEKIFDKFERADTKEEGVGLGLSITKDIVELHKGRIWVESKVSDGSKFIIVLPQDLRN